MVVNPAYRSAVGMCQLHFNGVGRPFVLVHNRAEFMPESVTAFQTFIADLFDHKQYRVLADWLLLIVEPISGVYFSWDTDGLGYDQGIWQGPYDPDSGYTTLSDETYRIILKAKIAINNWDGRNDSLPPILDAATAGSGLKMQIVDNQDMTISVWVFPETDISDVSLELIAAIKQGYLTVKSAGVWAGDVETPSVETPSEGSKFFGFDMDNEYIGGFDVGAWGTIL